MDSGGGRSRVFLSSEKNKRKRNEGRKYTVIEAFGPLQDTTALRSLAHGDAALGWSWGRLRLRLFVAPVAPEPQHARGAGWSPSRKGMDAFPQQKRFTGTSFTSLKLPAPQRKACFFCVFSFSHSICAPFFRPLAAPFWYFLRKTG